MKRVDDSVFVQPLGILLYIAAFFDTETLLAGLPVGNGVGDKDEPVIHHGEILPENNAYRTVEQCEHRISTADEVHPGVFDCRDVVQPERQGAAF